jgi:hypothetical protein
MGLLSFLKAPEAMDKAMDAVMKGGDALIYTEEEKQEMRKKMAEIQLRHIELTNQENNATSIARRWLSMVITLPFVILTLGSAIFHALGAEKIADHWQELAMEDYSNLVMMVAVFYFGTHVVKGFKKG